MALFKSAKQGWVFFFAGFLFGEILKPMITEKVNQAPRNKGSSHVLNLMKQSLCFFQLYCTLTVGNQILKELQFTDLFWITQYGVFQFQSTMSTFLKGDQVII